MRVLDKHYKDSTPSCSRLRVDSFTMSLRCYEAMAGAQDAPGTNKLQGRHILLQSCLRTYTCTYLYMNCKVRGSVSTQPPLQKLMVWVLWTYMVPPISKSINSANSRYGHQGTCIFHQPPLSLMKPIVCLCQVFVLRALAGSIGSCASNRDSIKSLVHLLLVSTPPLQRGLLQLFLRMTQLAESTAAAAAAAHLRNVFEVDIKPYF